MRNRQTKLTHLFPTQQKGMKLLPFIIPAAYAIQWFPLDSKGELPQYEPYTFGQEVAFDCIQRNIDSGEHKFDQKNRIMYGPFPICEETKKPLSLKYGINEDFNCTILFTDELFHLFQLYLHEDVPFSCRLPLSSEVASIEKGGAYVPFTFNFRGTLTDSHIDVDHSMNVLITKPASKDADQNTFISAIAYGSGTNTTRVVIGDKLTLNFAVRWLDLLQPTGSTKRGNRLPFDGGFYKFPFHFIPMSYQLLYFYIGLTSVVTSTLVLIVTYNWISLKLRKHRYSPLDAESKRD